VGQRFGAGHVANVLRGAETEQVAARGHGALTTFGLLREASISEIRGYIEQLIAHRLLRQTEDEYPVLALTGTGVALLKDPGAVPDLALARQRRPVRGEAPRRARIETESWQDVDRDLFERLRALRLDIARSRGVPPYVIFHDTTLREMARIKPTSVSALLGVRGVGARKAEDLGEAFVAVIARGTVTFSDESERKT
jgi:ATP-dependent DNA helicase RecQ